MNAIAPIAGAPLVRAQRAIQAPQFRPAPSGQGVTTAWVLILLSTLLTLCNCAKAIHIDDAAYVTYAAHIAQHPLAPYSFEICWGDELLPANQLLAPPVLLYWLAAAMRVFGDQPWLWKLSLWPLHALLVFSLFALFRRFARPLAMPLVWMTVLSPALLPSSNLMLDVPALALATSSTAVFLHGADRRSWKIALLAGLIAGLAMQTKYTALVVPPVLLAWGWSQGRLRVACLAVAASMAVFAGWELAMHWQQGASHFLYALQHRPGSGAGRVRHLISPTLTMTAALAPGALLTGLYAWRRSWWPLSAAAAALIGGLLAIAATAELETPLYGTLAVTWWLAMALMVVMLWRASRLHGEQARYTILFLCLWLGLEIAGVFAMSPFPAARRVLGVVVVATLLAGRFAWHNGAVQRGPLWFAAGVSAACGALLAFVDYQEANATRQAAEQAAAVVRSNSSAQTAWFSGAWGFQFYAERQGLRPLLPGVTRVRRGDLLVLARQPLNRLDLHLESAPVLEEQVIAIQDSLPWQTVLCYYGGRTPVRHVEGPRIRVSVYRVLEDFVVTVHGQQPPLR
jgi:4-amino-4-deoxy-L-arabinose transferase-like glycosyltransferase